MGKYIYRNYKAEIETAVLRNRLQSLLLEKGLRRMPKKKTADGAEFFCYPLLSYFSSRKPLSCISGLRMEILEAPKGSEVRFGVTFTKARYFTIFVFLFFCLGLPSFLRFLVDGELSFSLKALIWLPLGFLVHFHVRSRVFRTLEQLVISLKENKN